MAKIAINPRGLSASRLILDLCVLELLGYNFKANGAPHKQQFLCPRNKIALTNGADKSEFPYFQIVRTFKVKFQKIQQIDSILVKKLKFELSN